MCIEDNYFVQKLWHHIWKFAIFKGEFTHDIWIKGVGELPKTTRPFKDISLLKLSFFTQILSKVTTKIIDHLQKEN